MILRRDLKKIGGLRCFGGQGLGYVRRAPKDDDGRGRNRGLGPRKVGGRARRRGLVRRPRGRLKLRPPRLISSSHSKSSRSASSSSTSNSESHSEQQPVRSSANSSSSESRSSGSKSKFNSFTTHLQQLIGLCTCTAYDFRQCSCHPFDVGNPMPRCDQQANRRTTLAPWSM